VKPVIVVVLMLLVVTCFPQVGVGQTEPDIVVVPDDFGSIQQAIDNVKEGGKVFVHKGTYYENLTITKSVFLIGEDYKTTIIDSQGNATVVLVCADNVTLTGFTVKFSDTETPSHYMGPDKLHGIHLLYADYCNISGNNLPFNGYGIWLYNSHFNCVTENNCTDNWTGIRMEGSSNNKVTDNRLESNHYGIRFYGSQNNFFSKN
jgi:parallel beta-helix repeat protein